MSSEFESFGGSPHGAFVRSPHEVRGEQSVTLYATDTQHLYYIDGNTGAIVRTFSVSLGGGYHPLATDSAKNVYFINGDKQVYVYSPVGENLTATKGVSLAFNIAAIAIDSNDNVYVVEKGSPNRLKKFKDGSLLATFTVPGASDLIYGVHVSEGDIVWATGAKVGFPSSFGCAWKLNTGLVEQASYNLDWLIAVYSSPWVHGRMDSDGLGGIVFCHNDASSKGRISKITSAGVVTTSDAATSEFARPHVMRAASGTYFMGSGGGTFKMASWPTWDGNSAIRTRTAARARVILTDGSKAYNATTLTQLWSNGLANLEYCVALDN